MNKIGTVFYSKYFKSNIIVVDYIDNDNWWFMIEGGREVLKANTPYDYFMEVRE